jgi:aryl-alcohol dehydrogenase-like predicted oxidoreductase
MAVQQRIVPGTELRVSEIGFGCGGNAGLMVRGAPAEQRQVIARALELGINYFDTAPDYGDGIAEEALGRALRDIGERPLITSKVEIRRDDLGDVAGRVVRSAHESLRRLRVERLDVLQIHNGPTAAPPPMPGGDYHELWIEHFLGPGGAADGVRRLLAAGAIRYAGFICRGDDGVAVRTLLDTGLFHVINVPYTLLNPTAGMARPPGLAVDRDYGDVLGAARRRGCGAAVYSPLAGGVLAGAVAPHALARPLNPASDGARRKQILAGRFRFLAEACGGSLAQAAYRFVLMHPGVSTALGGFSSLEQMEEIAAVSGLPSLPGGLQAKIEAVWRTPLDDDPAEREQT